MQVEHEAKYSKTKLDHASDIAMLQQQLQESARRLSESLVFKGKTEDAARAFLKRWGPQGGAIDSWIVEVYPDKEHPGYVDGDRWFMKIIKGRVQGPKDKEYITACRWMIKNSVTRMDAQSYPDELPCEIRRVKAYGPPGCSLFSDLKAAAASVVQ